MEVVLEAALHMILLRHRQGVNMVLHQGYYCSGGCAQEGLLQLPELLEQKEAASSTKSLSLKLQPLPPTPTPDGLLLQDYC
jgi:hypothetical protein